MVSIDTVYQRVLALANKEQRGYIPPIKFNLYANQAQLDIFEQYFHDRSQFGRRNGNQTQVADSIDIIEEKIALFNLYNRLATITNEFGDVNLNDDFPDFYRLQMVRVDYVGISGFKQTEQVSLKNLDAHSLSPLLRRNKTYPIHTQYGLPNGGNRIKVYPYAVTLDNYQEFLPNSEISDIFTVPISFLIKKKNIHMQDLSRNNTQIKIPSWVYNGFKIWGLTAMITAEFLNIYYNANIIVDFEKSKR